MRWASAVSLLALAATVAHAADPPTIAMLVLPGGTSHAMLGAAFGRAMRRRGWRTAIVLPDFDVAALTAHGLLDDGLETIVFGTPPGSNEEFQATMVELESRPGEFIQLHTLHFERMCGQLLRDARAMAALRALRADLLLLDAAFSCSASVNELLGRPSVLFSPSDLADPWFSAFGGLPYWPGVHGVFGLGAVHPMGWRDRALATLAAPLLLRLGESVVGASARRLAAEFNLSDASLGRAFTAARLMLINAAPGVSPPRSLPPAVKLVGPLMARSEPEPLPGDLAALVEGAGAGGVVYASLGTTFTPGSCAVVEGLAAALAALNRTVVWHVAAARLLPACRPAVAALPPHVHVRAWVPQADLLAHPAVRVFLTHAGANSLLEAAWNGRPLVCMPLVADQPDNCEKAVKGGWALRFDKTRLSPATAPELVAALERAAADSSPLAQRAAAVGGVLRAHPRHPIEQAADWLEYARALPEGADLWDVGMALPLWRRESLDVWAVAAAALALLCGGAVLVVRAAWQAARRGMGRRRKAKTKTQ